MFLREVPSEVKKLLRKPAAKPGLNPSQENIKFHITANYTYSDSNRMKLIKISIILQKNRIPKDIL